MMTNADITVYNRRYDPDSGLDKWYGTGVFGVAWKGIMRGSSLQGRITEEDQIIVRIPTSATFSGKSFLRQEAWTEANPAEYWTLQNGDIIFNGFHLGLPDVTEDMGSLLAKGMEAITVLAWADNRDRRNSSSTRHLKAVGK